MPLFGKRGESKHEGPKQEGSLPAAELLEARKSDLKRGLGEEAANVIDRLGVEDSGRSGATRLLSESPRLIQHLGARGARKFAKTTIAEAQDKWGHRFDEDWILSETEREMRDQLFGKTYTVESRAAAMTLWMAWRTAEKVTSGAMEKAKLPDDENLHAEVFVAVYLSLE
jgi:hypothetical protein